MSVSHRYKVYTPPGYEKKKYKDVCYGSLYLLHGRGDHESRWLSMGNVKTIADELITSSRIPPLIIVMPYGFLSRRDQDTTKRRYRYPEPGEFNELVTEVIIPDVENRYRVLSGRQYRAIAGVSMGF